MENEQGQENKPNKKLIILLILIALIFINNKNTRLVSTLLLIILSIIACIYSIRNNDKSKKKTIYIFNTIYGLTIFAIIFNLSSRKTSYNNHYNINKTNISYIEDKENVIKQNEIKEQIDLNDESSIKTQEKQLKITMTKESDNYIGLNYEEVKKSMEELGFTNIITEAKETNDINIKNETVVSLTIKGTEYKKDDEYNPEDEVKIVYWNVKEEIKNEIIFPKEDSKLAKDFDNEISSSEMYTYINVDNIKNVPKIQKYENAYITDGVLEYINYLKELDYKVEITKIENKEPYKGFYSYETYFKVSKGSFYWTMYLGIQSELYVEYEFNIYPKERD